MFTISLHKVKINAPVGLYPQELVLGNGFEVDIDVASDVSDHADGRFVDYALLNQLIREAFQTEWKTLEEIARYIHSKILEHFPFVKSIKVTLRKMNPPMPGDIAFAQVVFEQ